MHSAAGGSADVFTQIGLSISDAVLLRRGVRGAAQGAPIPPSQQIPTRWNGLIDWTKEIRSFLAKGAKSSPSLLPHGLPAAGRPGARGWHDTPSRLPIASDTFFPSSLEDFSGSAVEVLEALCKHNI